MEIARSLGAKVVTNDWPGYAAQKNFAASVARNDWILSVDADEAIGPELASQILRLKAQHSDRVGYDFPRLARYCGRWIRHSGWYPDRKIRLYRKDSGQWVGQYVHESLELSGPVGHLDGDLLHYTCDTLDQHLKTVERYTDLAAREIRESGKPVATWKLFLGPPFSFVKSYMLQLGILDGKAGFMIARMAARYVYLKYSKARSRADR